MRPSRVAVESTRKAYIALVRAVLRSRKERCAPRCPGWFVSADDSDVERCDECASLNDYADTLWDADMAALPEAQKAHEKALREGEE